jgi:uncharacterized protein (DUF1330 family)
LSKFDGFVSRRLLEGEDGSKRIMVEFENIELFRKMHQSPEHQNFHNELGNFMEKPPQRQFYHVVAE